MCALAGRNAWNGEPGSPEEEETRGAVSYLDILDRIHRRLRPDLYLEIGVRHGGSLVLARGRAVGVDPRPVIDRPLPETARVVVQTSDDFFAEPGLDAPPDFCFIDGLHLFENALRDFINVERIAAPGAVVVVDDVCPIHPAQAERERRTRVWTGDVWRLVEALRRFRPDLFTLVLDAAPAGLLLVVGLDPMNRLLRDRYDEIVRLCSHEAVPDRVLQREGALDPGSPVLSGILDELAHARAAGRSPTAIVERLIAVASRPNPDAGR